MYMHTNILKYILMINYVCTDIGKAGLGYEGKGGSKYFSYI